MRNATHPSRRRSEVDPSDTTKHAMGRPVGTLRNAVRFHHRARVPQFLAQASTFRAATTFLAFMLITHQLNDSLHYTSRTLSAYCSEKCFAPGGVMIWCGSRAF